MPNPHSPSTRRRRPPSSPGRARRGPASRRGPGLLGIALLIGTGAAIVPLLLQDPPASRLSDEQAVLRKHASRLARDEARSLYAQGRFVEARDLCAQHLKGHPNDERLLFEFARVSHRLGAEDRANAAWERIAILMQPIADDLHRASPAMISLLAWSRLARGEAEQARLLWLQAAEVKGIRSSGENRDQFEKGEYYLLAGETELGFEWMRRSVEDHFVRPVWLRSSPALDGRRTDPRYEEMLRISLAKTRGRATKSESAAESGARSGEGSGAAPAPDGVPGPDPGQDADPSAVAPPGSGPPVSPPSP